jgi:competence protein ComFC
LIPKLPGENNRNLIDIFKDIIIPPICAVCGKISFGSLCVECMSEIEEIKNKICIYCGRPLFLDDLDTRRCNYCRDKNFQFYMHRSFAVYKGKIKKIIAKYKYSRINALKEIMIAFLTKTYTENYKYERIDYIDTVPGEHMEVLCRGLSKSIRIPFAGNILRVRKVLKQQGLDSIQRKSNIKGAFKVKNCLLTWRKNMMLVDDVWTTGSTLNEIAGILKKAGADKIYLLTFARGI